MSPSAQKTSRIAQVVAALTKYHAIEHTIIVAASAADPAAYQYIAPYAGCALGEYFMDQGKDALVIYDDLSNMLGAIVRFPLRFEDPAVGSISGRYLLSSQ